MSREKRVEIFQDTMNQCKVHPLLSKSVEKSVAGTKFYSADSKLRLKSCAKTDTKVDVTAERSFQAAKRLCGEYEGKRIAVHNFASATNPGGGVTRGSSAQEEALCRCSTLYPCLITKELYTKYYSMHRKRADVRYTDACIYTPDIIVFKSDTSSPELLDETEWYTVDVITCAAPNLREKPYNSMNPGNGKAVRVSDDELFEIHKKRGSKILSVAAENGADVLVLGAFGCGAFRNDPKVVARAYKEILKEYSGVFDNITFAVYCTPDHSENFTVFRSILENQTP
ncbi:MAG: TIGR02452 family protein [Oscillospiraceae bacterium]|nr:TIGR02452 family protein [Oscillospiraceae bacterium]